MNNNYLLNLINDLSKDYWLYSEDETVIYDDTGIDNYDYHYGASKIVIPIDEENCVLKRAFAGVVVGCDEDGEPADPVYIPNETDDCEIEYKIYLKSIEEGVEKFFAKTEKMDFGIYKQEKYIENVDDFIYNNIYEIENIKYDENFLKGNAFNIAQGLSLTKMRRRMDSDVFKLFIQNYSLNELHCLQSFLERYDINDISAYNVGIFDGGKIKIFDFCGYNSSTSKKIN